MTLMFCMLFKDTGEIRALLENSDVVLSRGVQSAGGGGCFKRSGLSAAQGWRDLGAHRGGFWRAAPSERV